MFAGGIMKQPDSFYPYLYLILELYSPDLVGVGIIVIFPSVLFNCFCANSSIYAYNYFKLCCYNLFTLDLIFLGPALGMA